MSKRKHYSEEECKDCCRKCIIAGQAFTSYTCQYCGKDDLYHNTAVPKYCSQCSEELNICRRCGKSLQE